MSAAEVVMATAAATTMADAKNAAGGAADPPPPPPPPPQGAAQDAAQDAAAADGAAAAVTSAVMAAALSIAPTQLGGAHGGAAARLLRHVEYAAVSDRGARPYNQDTFVLLPNPFGTVDADRPAWLFAVMDGHGQYGREVAHFLRDKLPDALRAQRAGLESGDEAAATAAMIRVFAVMQQQLAEDSGIDLYLSGSTVAVALLLADHMIAAHVGDSRIVLGQRTEHDGGVHAVQLTKDHTWQVPEEVKRATSSSRIAPLDIGGPPRLFHGSMPYPGIAVSRSLGDKAASRLGVSHVPDVVVRRWEATDAYIILASDGLWDTVSCKAAVRTASKHKTCRGGCEALCDTAIKDPDADNVTVVLGCLDFGDGPPPPAAEADALVAETVVAMTHLHVSAVSPT